jgi:hypothetical protein
MQSLNADFCPELSFIVNVEACCIDTLEKDCAIKTQCSGRAECLYCTALRTQLTTV